jgi:hypothetical protein
MLKTVNNRPPNTSQVIVHVGNQHWGTDATLGGLLKYAAKSVELPVISQNVVVFGPRGDCMIYMNGILAYHLFKPNSQFFEDMLQFPYMTLRGSTDGWGIYEDKRPDDADEDSFVNVAEQTEKAHESFGFEYGF